MGAGIGITTTTTLINQISAGTSTYLFLFQRTQELALHRGTIIRIEDAKPDDEARLIPKYYTDCGIDRQMRVWFKLSSLIQVTADALSHYHTASSGKRALYTASKSMASVFVIAEGASTLKMY